MLKNDGTRDEASRTASSTGLAPGVLPEVARRTIVTPDNSQAGVSTPCVPAEDLCQHTAPYIFTPPESHEPRHWYVLRATYGREKAAYDYLTAHHVKAFCPMQKTMRLVGGKRRLVVEPLLRNLFFAFGTKAEMQQYVYDNVHLPFLRFYYRHVHGAREAEREPLIVPDEQMRTFMIISTATDSGTFVSPDHIHLFERGELVRVTQGKFAGVVGRVAQLKGQKRVGIYIDGVATVATAYIPKAFLEKI